MSKPGATAGPDAVGLDDLIDLTAGTLNEAAFSKVAQALGASPALQAQLAQLERVRDGLVRQNTAETSPQAAAELADKLAARLNTSQSQTPNPLPLRVPGVFERLLQRLTARKLGLAYGALALQLALLLVWSGMALQQPEPSGASMRGAGPDSKQLGSVPEMVYINVSFEPATTESSLRALLLEIQGEIVSGPSQLGQYRIRVARNRSDLALARLRETSFVEQAGEARP